ncbi:MAG: M48 family metallopeptidase [Flavobacteriales bacterium]|jgi:STE24 endopeptidase|nr:M48 family metallopeptidase [Flavobacteriales bacterium]MBT3963789.1 M48 family metallopeptidase [Flavobacteriales bacterium]MBT4705430.1 M48 family metallopeptidase [Flavobacteriales bacterium]MBT4929819.1 M48 family metallopeptidase [Flavobacteriales bacterium]MBT5132193.1 M48 family metallopeptidase [Flavobacteriales bacterium]
MTYTIYLTLIIITVVSFLFGKWLDYLNDKAKSPELPKEAEGIYDEERYKTWLAYDKANKRVGVLSSSIGIIISLSLLVFGIFGWLDVQIRPYISNPILLALAYFAVLGIGSSIISFPFSVYRTFVIEERFGFNKTTVKTFILDMIKGTALAIVIGGPLSALIIWLFYELGEWFWLIAWIVVSGFSLFMTMFAASWIMPLFNKFTPLEDGELRTMIEDYCDKVGFKLNNLFVMDGSKRSSKSNAFFSGLGPKKKIALYDTLMETQSNEEIVAILAHEIGHYKKKHTLQSLVLSILQTGVMLYLLGLFLRMPEFSLALGAGEMSFHVGIIAFGIIFSPISTVIGIGMNMLSRKNEFEADAFARETYSGEPLASALKTLTAENLGNLKPHPWYVFVHYSHPPVLKRLERLIR